MRIHILGICGSFMGGLALLARQLGHDVSGSDAHIYPPMSTQLERAGIPLLHGDSATHLTPAPDQVIIGNSLSRGNEAVEYVLNQDLNYISGPQWLAENVLAGRHVLAVSGTHGKTTTTAMLAWVLESAGRKPGFLTGGVAGNFGVSVQPGGSDLFVVEADEYDTAFFDKRSKFIHYHPDTLIINNIEFDHADIFADIAAIRREFHHLLRTLPGRGQVIFRHGDEEINRVIEMGCWTPLVSFGIGHGQWQAEAMVEDFSSFRINHGGENIGTVAWPLIGRHNAENALAAIAAAVHVGVRAADACVALGRFKNVKRRLQRLACVRDITIYDDFAHHPTAIRATLEALRKRVGREQIIAILEPRSNTMKMGVHKEALPAALAQADAVLLYQGPDVQWELTSISERLGEICAVYTDIGEIIDAVVVTAKAGDHVLIMSNGAFENIQQRLISRLRDG
ncbi:MAG: UDP-N-acetylmuramate:L-alanyl-gamma-D-glutamyl-meso-diaminopimelate ligase [Gammaproteobacteria bacterium]